MVGKSRYCEICGVRELFRGGFFASFPIDENRCKIWLRQVGKEDLVKLPIEKLHETRHVCGDHFIKKDFGKFGTRLKKRAFPKLELSAPPLTDDQLREFPQHVASKAGAAQTTVVLQQFRRLEPVPSTSKEQPSTSRTQNINAAPDQSRPKKMLFEATVIVATKPKMNQMEELTNYGECGNYDKTPMKKNILRDKQYLFLFLNTLFCVDYSPLK